MEAEKSIIVSPVTCAILSRRALELAVKWVYANDSDLVLPYQDNISSLIHNESFRELIDSSMFNIIKYMVKLGNVAVHTNKPITRGEAVLALHNLHQFVSWIDYCYANEYTARDFDENELHDGDNKRTRPEELKDLYEKLSSNDRKLEELINENEELRKLRTEKRKENTENNHFKVDDISEAETRRRYIDVELKLSGWTFGKDVGIEVEIPGMPNNSINDDELAKRFDLVMYTIQLAKLQNLGVKRGIKNVMQTAERLSKLGTIPEVKEKKAVIERVMTSEFGEEANIFDMDKVREDLRELLKYLEKVNQKIYYTNFNDMIISEESNGSMYNVNDLKSYRKKVEFYLKEHQNDLAIYKLRNNKPLTEEDIKTLENVLFNELGSKSDYEKEYKETPVKVLVRKILGMDRKAANEAFSEFLNNQNLNSKQIHFVKLIVDYIVKNGFIEDNRVLMEDPFRSVGSIIELFENNVTERNNLIKRINEIRENIL